MSEGDASAATRQVDAEIPPARLGDLLGYLRVHKGVLAAVVVLSVLGAALALGQPLAVNAVIGAVGTGASIRPAVVALVLLVLGSGLVGAVQQYLLARTAEGVVLDARRRLVGRLLRLPVREYDARRAGDLVSRVGSDTTAVRGALTGGLVDAAGGTLVFLGALIAMLLLDPVLLGITLAVVAIAVVAVVVASSRIQALSRSAQDAVGRLGAGVERAVSGIRTIRASNATEREVGRLEDEAYAAYGYGVQVAGVEAVLWPVSGLAIQGSFLAVLGVGGYRVAAGALSIADLVTFILFLFMMIMPLGQFFSVVTTVRSALGALARIEEILRVPTEEAGDRAPARTSEVGGTARPVAGAGAGAGAQAGAEAGAGAGAASSGGAELVYEGVSFGYRTGREVLTDVHLTIARGTTTAIVGPSGAGKSTLLALAERFHEPDAGTIRLDGVDLRDLSRADLRARLGYVEQEAPVLAGTIRENLVLAAPSADESACRDVLVAVNLLERVDEHPDGLDAQLGDDGVGLSGGERQRLAIARALLADAPLLLLDEPTSSLDSRNERALHEAIHSAASGRTVLIVAHRLSTVAGADLIAVLDQGRVVATGTHAELLETSELYGELARHQLLV